MKPALSRAAVGKIGRILVLLLLLGWLGPLLVWWVAVVVFFLSQNSAGLVWLAQAHRWVAWVPIALFIVHWLGELYYVQHAGPFADTTARRRKWDLFVFLLPPVAVIWLSVRQITGWRRPADEEVEAEGWTPPVGLMDWLKQWRLLVAMVSAEVAGSFKSPTHRIARDVFFPTASV